MILEIEDITEHKSSFGHVAFPPGVTLGDAMDSRAELRKLANLVVEARVNGLPTVNWREVSPGHGDKVKLLVGPGYTAVINLIEAAFYLGSSLGISGTLGLISVISFFVSLFNTPKPPKLQTGPRESPTYGFEGLQDTFVPGGPIPVVYGQHRVGGQVLMFFTEVASGSSGKQVVMNELLGLCHGEVGSIGSAEISNIPATDISSSVAVTVRLGTSSQGTIPGFERIRNTFHDGREITSASIIYRSVGNDVQGFDLITVAPQGLITRAGKGKHPNRAGANWVDYGVEHRRADLTAWTVVASPRRVTGQTQEAFYDQFSVDMPTRGAYDLRVTWLGALLTRPEFDTFRLSLNSVTEYQDVMGPLSGTALMGVRAVATAQLQGGRPNLTALVRGKLVRVYTSPTVFTTQWTQNPAWCVFDYMTNSVYGQGAALADVNIQSFIDFATMADSQCNNCDGAMTIAGSGGAGSTVTITESTPVTFVLTNGTAPFSWSTTTGCLTIAADGRSATVTCPPNSVSVTGIAYRQYATAILCTGCGGAQESSCGSCTPHLSNNGCCVSAINYGIQSRNCDGSANGGCANNSTCEGTCFGGPTCTRTICGPLVDDNSQARICAAFATISTSGGSCGFIESSLTAGCIIDRRTAAMITSGCAPCILTMSGGAVVTVTDENGLSISGTVSV